jgi:hypothetical protein
VCICPVTHHERVVLFLCQNLEWCGNCWWEWVGDEERLPLDDEGFLIETPPAGPSTV